jgi:hypothetical protein
MKDESLQLNSYKQVCAIIHPSSFIPHPFRITLCLALLILKTFSVGSVSLAADNELSLAEKADRWKLLFDGVSAKGWRNSNKKPVAAKVEDGALNPHGSGGYLLVYDKEFGDFVLKCDVKMDQPFCNSGIFLRVGDLKDPVQTGIEMQVMSGKEADVHSFGAIYDLVAPSKNAAHGAGTWDAVEIRCEGPKISVKVNGEKVASIHTDEWSEAGKGPDGTPNKFKKAVKDFPRKGYVGLQDHGYNAWYKNIKLKPL